MDTIRPAHDEVYVYTIGRPGFVLQQVVDTYAVQSTNDESRPISVVFGWSAFISTQKKNFRPPTRTTAAVKGTNIPRRANLAIR